METKNNQVYVIKSTETNDYLSRSEGQFLWTRDPAKAIFGFKEPMLVHLAGLRSKGQAVDLLEIELLDTGDPNEVSFRFPNGQEIIWTLPNPPRSSVLVN